MPTANTGGRYMYNEIAKMTLTSYEGNRQVANYLAKKLKSKNHNVKWKVLLIIKHVALKGSPSVRHIHHPSTTTNPPPPTHHQPITTPPQHLVPVQARHDARHQRDARVYYLHGPARPPSRRLHLRARGTCLEACWRLAASGWQLLGLAIGQRNSRMARWRGGAGECCPTLSPNPNPNRDPNSDP